MIMGHLSPSEGNLETPTTYSIGHLSQDLDEVSDLTVLEEAKKAFIVLNNLEAEIEAGNMDSLLAWLREKVHKHGKYFTAKEVCEKATGEALNFKYFLDYAKAKYSEIYGL